jgi:predicted O-methyltransferase YrrM
MTTVETAPGTGVSADDFAERILTSTLGAIEMLSMYVGDRLGWYRALADNPATAADLADRTSTHVRYAHEWLEQQAVYGILDTDPDQPADSRRYTLAPGAVEALTDGSSLAYLGPLPRMVAASAIQLPALLEAYRTGGGVSWEQLGDDARWSQADLNRPWFERALGPALRGVASIDDVLRRSGARIADIGCGFGWSTVALARAYPNAEVIGIDVDAPSVEAARRHAEVAGVGDRVRFELADGKTVAAQGTYDAAFAFECIHDMARPVDVLAGIHAAVKPDGIVVVMDEAVAEEFTAPGDDLERLMYGFSLFVCLPDGMSSTPSVGTGTVMRPTTLASYAELAGFSGVDVLPIHDFGFWRFYQLHR